jgi:tRNA/rRNA methyltransferase
MSSKSKDPPAGRRPAPTADPTPVPGPHAPPTRLRVVLVRPEFAGNIGAAARAAANFDVAELVLVAPRALPTDPQAAAMAVHGDAILSAARIVPTLDAALADCTMVVGTTARAAGLYRGQSMGRPADVFAALAGEAAARPAALVFGPEDHGLTNEETARCSRLVSLPTGPAYPVLNLAQAVGICLYEIFLARSGLSAAAPKGPSSPGGTTEGPKKSKPPEAPAAFAHRERMFEKLEDALTRVGFLFGDNPTHLMFALRNLILRAGPTQTETDILIGLARQIRWYVDHHPRDGGSTDTKTGRS